MSTYKVRVKAEVNDSFFGILNKRFDGVELVDAASAKEAKEKVEREIHLRLDSDEVTAYVADVELVE